MMFEVTVWLMVYLTEPSGRQYEVIDIKEPMEQCIADVAEWTQYAMKADRGIWTLNASCQVERKDSLGVSLKKKPKKQVD